MMKKSNFKFIIKVIILMSFFKPLAINSIVRFSIINKVWDIFRVIVWMYAIIDTLLIKKRISKCVSYIMLIEFIFLCSTLIKNGSLNEFLVQAISIITFCMIVYNWIKEDIFEFCKAWFYGLSILICIHFIYSILYPNGLGYDTTYYNPIHFLGNKNGLIKFLMPAIVSGVLMSEIEGKKIQKKVWLIILLCIIICIKADSVTSLLGIFMFLIVLFLRKVKFNNEKFDFQKIFFVTFLIMIIITIIETTGKFTIFLNYFIDDNKLQNYVDRITIWKEAVDKISKSPIIGYGMPKNGGHILINGKYFYSHNGYMEIVLYGGAIGFIFFTIILKKFMFVKSRFINNRLVCIAGGIVGFLIMMLTETHIFTLAFWGFVVIYEYLCNESQDNQENKQISLNKKIS